ncbi:MAG: hypothetical protein LDL26_00020 [Caenispirillum bisanense]|nr:hypothetical protein [Caenispirillum bisanense]MCA1971254.1 hypothetical protein [Caenispirillum sp.]
MATSITSTPATAVDLLTAITEAGQILGFANGRAILQLDLPEDLLGELFAFGADLADNEDDDPDSCGAHDDDPCYVALGADSGAGEPEDAEDGDGTEDWFLHVEGRA